MERRVALWDNVRFFLITTVVVGHFADEFTAQSDVCKSLFLFIYAFHMPLFIWISGHLHKNTRIREKCLFYISAGFLLKILLTVFRWIIGYSLSFSLLADGSLPWFFFALAAYTLIAYALRDKNKWFILILSVLIACFCGFDTTVSDWLYLSRVVIFFPFYWLGTMIDSELVLRAKRKKWVIVCSVAVMLIWAAVCAFSLNDVYVLRHLFTGRNPFSDNVRAFGPFARLLAYAVSGLTSFALVMITPARNVKWLTKMGSRSIDVYVWHWPVFLIAYGFFHINDLFSLGMLGKASYFLVAVFLSILLSQGGFISYPLETIRKFCYERKELS
ncbi:MAG: acyltransferase family protein [Clostridia bacterium]|nr:acyltransferase family protein [Clostridia bacterium]